MQQPAARPAARSEPGPALESRLNWHAIENLVLLRLHFGAAEGETEVQLRKDLHGLVMQDMSAADWRAALGQVIVRLVDTGFMRPVRANAYMGTEKCEARLLTFLGTNRMPTAPWHEIRDGHLIAIALGLVPTSRLIARLITAEGLRLAILSRHYDLPLDITSASLEQLRNGLAKIAEQRGLTVGIRDTVSKENRLSQKEAVMMGARLLKSRHVVESDGELIACLAAEAVSAMNESAAELRHMLFRRLIDNRESSELTPVKRGDIGALPDLAEFTEQVKIIAAEIAVGWPGNRRAFISTVWDALRDNFPEWPMDEEQYKAMILSAHRHGLLRLAIADLRDKAILEDVTRSRITYKNSEWHFIRVEDSND